MILHGDATDTSLLDEENIDEMDALSQLQALMRKNLLLALMAKAARYRGRDFQGEPPEL